MLIRIFKKGKAQAEVKTIDEPDKKVNEKSDSESEDDGSKSEEENDQDQSEESSDDDAQPKKKRKSSEGDKKDLDKNKKYNLKRKTGTLDVQEKRTIFIRNLSFDSKEETLQDVFSKFGPIKFVKICYDKDLERPKGTAFIQFESSESATNACLETETLEVDMRTLHIDLAIPREKVIETIDEKKSVLNEKKDKRNLVLAKEGVIYANSYEAEGISKSDMLKRQNLEAANAQKLKLLHYFVSPTRLSVHNIPIKCTDDELRNIFENSVKEFKGSLKQRAVVKCKIMRDLTRVNSEGVCKSRGYGFVEFSNPQLALKALHATNNNPNLFDNGTRLIVQFSIEDMRALKKQQTRLERSKQKLLQKNKFK
jgi:nucleolar protein 4